MNSGSLHGQQTLYIVLTFACSRRFRAAGYAAVDRSVRLQAVRLQPRSLITLLFHRTGSATTLLRSKVMIPEM